LLTRLAARACAAMIVLVMADASRADQLPLWEAGAGLAAIDFPDYRGSDQRHRYVLPIPYVVYRGERLKIDRQKVRGLLFSSDIAELDVSVNGSVPVRSRDNRAREGMPNLDPTLEVGPSLNVFLYRGPSNKMSVDLRLPLRAVEATDFRSVHHEGWLFHPHVNIDLKDVPGPGWNLGLLAGPLFGSQRYHNYFYGVAPAFATSARPAYEAKSGYAGTQVIGALSKRFQSYWFGAFVKADSLHGAVFEDSPLVKRRSAFTAGVAVAWVFSKSAETVEARE
jgi:outer membrane scaffolding protein for murein synthesis (MipA/OmpV family)